MVLQTGAWRANPALRFLFCVLCSVLAVQTGAARLCGIGRSGRPGRSRVQVGRVGQCVVDGLLVLSVSVSDIELR